jgi:hypothetical protein
MERDACRNAVGIAFSTIPGCPESSTGIGDRVWYDSNHNGMQDTSEPGLADVLVRLLSDSLIVISATHTSATGEYLFTDLSASTYYVEFIPPRGMIWTRTHAGPDDAMDSDADRTTGRTTAVILLPNTIKREYDAGMVSSNDYQEFGDAPDSYHTLKASGGAQHDIGDIWLGDLIDGEADGQATDLDNRNGLNDEDGVRFLGSGSSGGPYMLPYQPNSLGAVKVLVNGNISSQHPAFLHAWIDWNGDGNWHDPQERIITSSRIEAPGPITVEFAVPPYIQFKDAWARFRLDDQDLRSADGHADNGEVEDYLLEKWTPVELESFAAIPEADGIMLTWSTCSETENLGFVIYRSEDPNGGFVRVNSELVPAQGSSSTRQKYSYRDDNVVPGKTYFYQLADMSYGGQQVMLASLQTSTLNKPATLHLAYNYPNPFNPGTTIKYSLAQDGPVRLVVLNISGQIIRHLVDQIEPTGDHSVFWDGKDDSGGFVAAGVYFYQMTANSHTLLGKMTYAK